VRSEHGFGVLRVISIKENCEMVRTVSNKQIWKPEAQEAAASAKANSRRTTGIIVSDKGREIGALLSEYYDVYCYSRDNARLAAPRFDATKLQFAILEWADRERILGTLAWIRTMSNLPVIVMGPASEPECVAALEGGAADYMTDSVSGRELLARLRALLRYHQPLPKREALNKGQIYEFGEWRYDVRKRCLTAPQGVKVALSRSEYAILMMFLERPGRVLTRESLSKPPRMTGDSIDRSIDVCVLRLRRKLSAVAPENTIISTERGVGYRFALPVKRHSSYSPDVDPVTWAPEVGPNVKG
jgi:two-component system OmpR family response regulator